MQGIHFVTDAQGRTQSVLVRTTRAGRASATTPAACAHGCYLKISVTSMDYEILNILGGGETVLVERTETWHFPSGAAPTLCVMCTIELDDDKIAAWREYWNGEELMSQMPPEFFEGVEHALGEGEAMPQ